MNTNTTPITKSRGNINQKVKGELEKEVQKIYGKTFIDSSILPLTKEFKKKEISKWQEEDRL